MKGWIQKLFLLFLISAVAYAWSLRGIGQFPETDQMHPALRTAPFQADTDAKPFIFEYHDTEYYIEPVQTYEISGLVVSHNNISSITDAYHTSESVDFKDLCLVWGQNAKKDLLDQMKFWSEPWTCWARSTTADADGRFFPDELSNNHLLARKKEVRKLINNVKVGDQVQLRGFLINYGLRHSPQYSRKSSLVRDDSGNGACETIFVEQAKILREANSGWRMVHGTAKASCLLLLLILPVMWFWDIQVTHKKRREDLEQRLKESPHLRYKLPSSRTTTKL